MKVFKLKQSFSISRAAIDINLSRKNDIPLEIPCSRVSEKGQGFLINPNLRYCNSSILAGSHPGERGCHPGEPGPILVSRVCPPPPGADQLYNQPHHHSQGIFLISGLSLGSSHVQHGPHTEFFLTLRHSLPRSSFFHKGKIWGINFTFLLSPSLFILWIILQTFWLLWQNIQSLSH